MTAELKLPDFINDRLYYGQSWDFCEQPASYSLPLVAVSAGANADDDVAATLVGVIPAASRLIGGYAVVSANSAGIDANNTSAWVVAVGGTTYMTKTNTANLVANTPVSMGTPALTDCAAGSAVTLAITNGTAADLNSASCMVALDLCDSASFPAAGLKLVATNGGTATISDGAKGILALTTGTTDNDEIYLASSTETVKLASGKSFIGEALIQFTDTNSVANVSFGFSNAIAANELVDNGAGPKATGDYALLWKVDGGTKWYAGVQTNGTAYPTTDTVSTVTAGGSSYQRLRVEVTCQSSTEATAMFWVDGVNIRTEHFTYASATEMQLVLGAKTGGSEQLTVNVDYLGYSAIR